VQVWEASAFKMVRVARKTHPQKTCVSIGLLCCMVVAPQPFMKLIWSVVLSSVAAAVFCTFVMTNEYRNEIPVETFGRPMNVLGALGDSIAPGSFPEYRLPGKLPGTMPPAAKMISRHRLVEMIQGIETDRIKMNNLREKVQELKAQDMAIRLQARTLMLNLKSNIVGVTDQNEQVSVVSCIFNMAAQAASSRRAFQV
jgi:hypothetical protein